MSDQQPKCVYSEWTPNISEIKFDDVSSIRAGRHNHTLDQNSRSMGPNRVAAKWRFSTKFLNYNPFQNSSKLNTIH